MSDPRCRGAARHSSAVNPRRRPTAASVPPSRGCRRGCTFSAAHSMRFSLNNASSLVRKVSFSYCIGKWIYSPSHPARDDQAVLPTPQGRRPSLSSRGERGLSAGWLYQTGTFGLLLTRPCTFTTVTLSPLRDFAHMDAYAHISLFPNPYLFWKHATHSSPSAFRSSCCIAYTSNLSSFRIVEIYPTLQSKQYWPRIQRLGREMQTESMFIEQ